MVNCCNSSRTTFTVYHRMHHLTNWFTWLLVCRIQCNASFFANHHAFVSLRNRPIPEDKREAEASLVRPDAGCTEPLVHELYRILSIISPISCKNRISHRPNTPRGSCPLNHLNQTSPYMNHAFARLRVMTGYKGGGEGRTY